MTGIPDEVLTEFRKAQALVSVAREEIDDDTIQGFIVDFDSRWVVLQRIDDFCHDGLLFLRKADLTAIESRATDRFQKSMLEADGVLEAIDFSFRLPSGGVFQLLSELPSDRIIIVEDETEADIFLVGTVSRIDDGSLAIRFFSGVGDWDDEPSEIEREDITSMSFLTHYTLAYERFFERRPPVAKSEPEI